jgi:hypothetical protein
MDEMRKGGADPTALPQRATRSSGSAWRCINCLTRFRWPATAGWAHQPKEERPCSGFDAVAVSRVHSGRIDDTSVVGSSPLRSVNGIGALNGHRLGEARCFLAIRLRYRLAALPIGVVDIQTVGLESLGSSLELR